MASTNGRTGNNLEMPLPAERNGTDLSYADIYSTAENGNIIVKSNGSHLNFGYTDGENIKSTNTSESEDRCTGKSGKPELESGVSSPQNIVYIIRQIHLVLELAVLSAGNNVYI